MKTSKSLPKPRHIGSNILAFDRDKRFPHGPDLFMGFKPPQNRSDRRGHKRETIGPGKWSIAGGGFEPRIDRSGVHTARRELFEESGEVWWLPLRCFSCIGILDVYHGHHASISWQEAEYIWRVHLFEVVIPFNLRNDHRPNGEYVKTAWHSVSRLPWRRMVASDRLWLPRLIAGEKLRIRLMRNHLTKKVLKCEMTPYPS